MKARTRQTTAKQPPRAQAPVASGKGIGVRIAFFRRQQAISLESLARKSGLTKSFISKLERGLSVPSISTAMALAESFGLTVGQLMGEQEHDDAICVVRKGERQSFMRRRGTENGYDHEMLAAGKRFKMMEPYIIRPRSHFRLHGASHSGQEFLFVLSGSLEIEFGDKVVRLEAGDAVYFDATVPHRSRSVKGRIAEALVVVTA